MPRGRGAVGAVEAVEAVEVVELVEHGYFRTRRVMVAAADGNTDRDIDPSGTFLIVRVNSKVNQQTLPQTIVLYYY